MLLIMSDTSGFNEVVDVSNIGYRCPPIPSPPSMPDHTIGVVRNGLITICGGSECYELQRDGKWKALPRMTGITRTNSPAYFMMQGIVPRLGHAQKLWGGGPKIGSKKAGSSPKSGQKRLGRLQKQVKKGRVVSQKSS